MRNALIKEGWTITHDPFRIQWGKRDLYVDLGAERLIGAQKGESKIAVEIKSFLGASDIAELEQALGQLVIYHDVLEEVQPGTRSKKVELESLPEPLRRVPGE